MPGDRRQILSLLRLPIPPLQPLFLFYHLQPSYCNCVCKLGTLGNSSFSNPVTAARMSSKVASV